VERLNSTAQATERVELAEGHTDLIEVTVDGGALNVRVKDDTKPGGSVFRDPSNVQVRVRDAAIVNVPAGNQFSFLGAAGSSIHLLPQVQQPGILWPGWSTERLGSGQVVGDKVTVTLSSFSGPGDFSLFTTNQFGAPNVIFQSTVPSKSRVDVPIRTHAHASWAFEKPGEYRLGITASAALPGGSVTSSKVTYVVIVGDATPLAPWGQSTTTTPANRTNPTTTSVTSVPKAPGQSQTTTSALSGATQQPGAGPDVDSAVLSAQQNNATGSAEQSLARTGLESGTTTLWAGISVLVGASLIAGAARRRARRME